MKNIYIWKVEVLNYDGTRFSYSYKHKSTAKRLAKQVIKEAKDSGVFNGGSPIRVSIYKLLKTVDVWC